MSHPSTPSKYLSRRRQRRDAARRTIAIRTSQPGHPLRAQIVVTTLGRTSLGRSAPRVYRFAIDLLLGQASEEQLLRNIEDALDSTYMSDVHMSQRYAALDGMAERDAANAAEHEAFMRARGVA